MDQIYAQIDLLAIRHNLAEAARLNRGRNICAVVKADAYGHGAVRVAATAVDAGASFLAVARAEEAVPIREAGINVPILVLGLCFGEQLALASELSLTVTVCSMEDVRLLSAMRRPPDVHIKLDTGMGRLGVRGQEELAALLEGLKHSGARVTGAYTHFCVADSDEGFTQEQYRLFSRFIRQIREAGFRIIAHCQNSAAAMNRPDMEADMLREGIMLYGCYPDESFRKVADLRPAMSWRARVTYIKTLHPGDTVSYGRLFCAQEEMRVATLPVGYADGYKRSMTGKAKVIVGGQLRPVIGRICMDMCMVDVTGLPVNTGDEVTLMGSAGGQSITAEELGLWSGSFNYEILTSVGKRVKRIYCGA